MKEIEEININRNYQKENEHNNGELGGNFKWSNPQVIGVLER